MLHGLDELDLTHVVAADVGRREARPIGRSGRKERTHRTFPAERQAHTLFGPIEKDRVEILGRRGSRLGGGRAERELHGRPARLPDVAVVQRPIARPRLPDAPLADIELRRRKDPRRRSRYDGAAAREIGPVARRDPVGGVEQAVLPLGRTVEDDRAVGGAGLQRPAPVGVAVGQTEHQIAARAEVERVEAREPVAAADAVVGGIAQPVFEPHAHGRDGPVDDPEVVVAETVTVVVGIGPHHPLLVLGERRGRLDDVAHDVPLAVGRGVDATERIGRGSRGRQPHGAESHAFFGGGRVARRIGAAHVERPEKGTLHEPALDRVARPGEDRPQQGVDLQKGVVVVGGEYPERRLQIRRIVLRLVAVAQDGQELHGALAAPSGADLRRGQQTRIAEIHGIERPAGGLLGPRCGGACDLHREPFGRSAEEPERTRVEPCAVVPELGTVRRAVERRESRAEERVVDGASGQKQFHGDPLAQLGGRAEPVGIVAERDARTGLKVADDVIDDQLHGIRICSSRLRSVPWRRMPAASVIGSTGVYAPSATSHTCGEERMPASAASICAGS